jgi:hypothetical protein
MGIATGILGGTTTMLARSATRRAMHGKSGAPRLPQAARRRQGMGTMLVWAAAAGVILALADILIEQRRESTRPEEAREPQRAF